MKKVVWDFGWCWFAEIFRNGLPLISSANTHTHTHTHRQITDNVGTATLTRGHNYVVSRSFTFPLGWAAHIHTHTHTHARTHAPNLSRLQLSRTISPNSLTESSPSPATPTAQRLVPMGRLGVWVVVHMPVGWHCVAVLRHTTGYSNDRRSRVTCALTVGLKSNGLKSSAPVKRVTFVFRRSRWVPWRGQVILKLVTKNFPTAPNTCAGRGCVGGCNLGDPDKRKTGKWKETAC